MVQKRVDTFKPSQKASLNLQSNGKKGKKGKERKESQRLFPSFASILPLLPLFWFLGDFESVNQTDVEYEPS